MEIIERGNLEKSLLHTCLYCKTKFKFDKTDIQRLAGDDFYLPYTSSDKENYSPQWVKCPVCGHACRVFYY